MSQPLVRFLQARNLGRLRQSVPLGGRLSLEDGEEAEPHLCRTRRGAFVVGVDDAGRGRVLDVLASDRLHYEVGVVSDRLVVGGEAFPISAGRRRAARTALALARLARPGRGPVRPPASVTVRRLSAVELAWLSSWLEPDEELLVWWPTGRELSVTSTWGPRTEAEENVLVTDRRAVRCAVGELGDARLEEVGSSATPVPRGTAVGRSRGRVDGEVLAAAYGLVFEEAAARRLEVARLNWRHRKEEPHHRARAAVVVRELLAADDPYGVLTAFFLRTGLGLSPSIGADAVRAALQRLLTTEADSARLARWWSGFELEVAAGMLLVERLRDLEGGARWSLALHAALREEATRTTDGLAHALVEVEWADHLLAAGERVRAAEVCHTVLGRLPPPAIDDFMPQKGPRAQEIRVRALTLLADAQASERPRTLVRLLQRRPLDLDVAVRLRDEGEGFARTAAEQVAELLAPGGLGRLDVSDVRAARPQPLAVEEIELLEHPATRGSQAMGAFQAYLAVAAEPDRSALRDYCERLSATQMPEAAAAVADAVLLLGAPAVDTFISRGEKGVGVRGYEGRPAFLLVGGHHLDPQSEFFLSRDELRFVVASEVAHIRFKHKRMTPQEVWAGAWEKSRAGLDLVFTLLPAFKGWDMAEKLLRAVSLTRQAVGKVDKAARKAIREESLGLRIQDLVEAHRLMQLTADRAGLVLARDLRSALRAMFLVDPTLRAELPLVERHGVASALLRKDDEGELYFPDVLIRVSALIGFYVGGAYARLSRAAFAAEPDQPAEPRSPS